MSQPPPKLDVAKQILGRGNLRLLVDARKTGVDVPEHLRAQPRLVLEVGHAMLIPIPDLRLDENGLSATLSFSQVPYGCTVPWSAVYGLVGSDDEGVIWESEVPPDAPPGEAKDTGLSCSFCGQSQLDAKALVAADRAWICDACVVRFRPPPGLAKVVAYVRERFVSKPVSPPRGSSPYREVPRSTTTCSFCNLEVSPLHEGLSARICVPCAALADEALLEQSLKDARAKV